MGENKGWYRFGDPDIVIDPEVIGQEIIFFPDAFNRNKNLKRYFVETASGRVDEIIAENVDASNLEEVVTNHLDFYIRGKRIASYRHWNGYHEEREE